MRIAGAHDSTKFETPTILHTPDSYEEGIKLFTDTVESIAAGEKVSRIIIGIAGVLSADKRTIAQSEHLPGWGGHSFAEDVEKSTNAEVILQNDTALVGLGEATYGAGKGSPIVAYITVSTGVNGVRIVDGAIDRTAMGFEIGGQYMTHDGTFADLNTFEDLVSGSAIHRKYGVHPRDLGHDSPVWDELARITALAIHNTILHWSPDTVVFGGSMFNEIGIPVPGVEKYLTEIMKKFPHIPRIVHSALHDEGGLYGGLASLR